MFAKPGAGGTYPDTYGGAGPANATLGGTRQPGLGYPQHAQTM